MRIRTSPALALATLLLAVAQADDAVRIEDGSAVTFHYSLSLADGTFVESNRDSDPMAYTQGEGKIIPGVERQMLGHAAGDEFTITVEPEEAYGEIDPSAYQDVPIDMIPEDARVVGAKLTAANFPGLVTVKEVQEESVTLDFNHPLAGEVLEFEIDVVTVNPPDESE